MTVVSLGEEREKRSPHLEGRARCVDCQHVWQAVAPVGTMTLECPECHGMKGLWTYTFGPDYENCVVYACVTCNSTHFTFYRTHTKPLDTRFICVGCGSLQSTESLFG